MSEEEKEEPRKELKTTTRPTTVATQQDTYTSNEPKQGKPVPVDGDITPITREPITQVDSSQWAKLSLEQLHEQLMALEQRLLYAEQIGHIDMVTQIKRGVIQLNLVIKNKTPQGIKLI